MFNDDIFDTTVSSFIHNLSDLPTAEGKKEWKQFDQGSGREQVNNR